MATTDQGLGKVPRGKYASVRNVTTQNTAAIKPQPNMSASERSYENTVQLFTTGVVGEVHARAL